MIFVSDWSASAQKRDEFYHRSTTKPVLTDVNSGSVNIKAHPGSTANQPHEPEAAGASWKEGFTAN